MAIVILVVSDLFSKWVEIFAIPEQTAEVCAEVLVNEVITRFGCPYNILSDQGRNFESKLFSDLCRLLEVRKLRTSPGHPQCNGQTERFNRTLLAMIKSYLKEQGEWDLHLGCLAAAYRSSVHASTGLTPNLIMLGREVRIPVELLVNTSGQEEVASYGEYVSMLRHQIQIGTYGCTKSFGHFCC